MTDALVGVFTYLVLTLGILVVGLIIVVIAKSSIEAIWGRHPKPTDNEDDEFNPAPAPQQPPGLPKLVCPAHGLEHLCKDDDPEVRRDLEILADFENFLTTSDGRWFRRMERRLR